jgi:hypothetical protein
VASKANEGAVKKGDALLKANPGLAEKVRLGEMSMAAAVRESKREAIKANLESVKVKEAKALEGVYDVIVIDPPWPMEKIERDVRPNQSEFEYPTMSLEEIGAMSIPPRATVTFGYGPPRNSCRLLLKSWKSGGCATSALSSGINLADSR